MNLESLYQRSPAPLQNLFCSLYGLRLNRRRYSAEYLRLEAEVIARDRWSPEQLAAFCMKRLQMLVKHAATTTPYYRRLFADLRFDPSDLQTPEDLQTLPVLDKQTVQQQLTEFSSEAAAELQCSTVHTSGTTGTGLIFPMALAAEQEQWAVWWRYRQRFGIDRTTWYAHFYGKSVVPLHQNEPPFWRINYPGRQLFFSGYHMTDRNLPAYVEELNRRQPPWIQGYPSLLALLASFMLNGKHRLTYRPRVVTIGAESLLPHQKQLIEQAFGAPCRQHYGMTEAVANISECPEGRLHIDEDFGLVELIPAGDNSAKIIATGYTNPAFPLLRYDTGDVAELESSDVRCPCGLAGRLVKSIDGRVEDYVVTPDGRRIGRMDHIFKDMVNIRESQIFQETPEEVVFRVVKGDRYGKADEALLLHESRKRLGNEIRISIEYVTELERSSRGKLRFVISRIKNAHI